MATMKKMKKRRALWAAGFFRGNKSFVQRSSKHAEWTEWLWPPCCTSNLSRCWHGTYFKIDEIRPLRESWAQLLKQSLSISSGRSLKSEMLVRSSKKKASWAAQLKWAQSSSCLVEKSTKNIHESAESKQREGEVMATAITQNQMGSNPFPSLHVTSLTSQFLLCHVDVFHFMAGCYLSF